MVTNDNFQMDVAVVRCDFVDAGAKGTNEKKKKSALISIRVWDRGELDRDRWKFHRAANKKVHAHASACLLARSR